MSERPPLKGWVMFGRTVEGPSRFQPIKLEWAKEIWLDQTTLEEAFNALRAEVEGNLKRTGLTR